MSILDFINSNDAPKSNNVGRDPLKAFFDECDELESQCPNLELVRKHIRAFRLDMPMLPDCEINYDLGFVYDPEFRAKYWLYKTGKCSNGEEYVPSEYRKPWNAEINTRPNCMVWDKYSHNGYTCLADFLLECRGYNEAPWKYKRSKDDNENVHYIEDFLLFMDCCKNKDWKPYFKQHLANIKEQAKLAQTKKRATDRASFVPDPNTEEKLRDYMKNYFQVQVLNQLVWTVVTDYYEPKYLYTYEKDWIVIENDGVKWKCGYKTCKLPIYRIVSKEFLTAEEIFDTKINVGPNRREYSPFTQPDWHWKYYREHVRVWDPRRRPELALRYHSFLVDGLINREFWDSYLKKGLNAASCFKLYVYWLRDALLFSKRDPVTRGTH